MNTLFIIATPIGNIKEISVLALEKFNQINTILCEDTRVTRKLLSLLDIEFSHKKFISYNKFSENNKILLVLSLLKDDDCILVSDAGYPVISDPGFPLVKELRRLKINIQVINGPCALIHAIVGSGIDSRKIYWASFLSKRPIRRENDLQHLKLMTKWATVVYYEPRNSLKQGLEAIEKVFGDITICVARELSKMFEHFYIDKVSVLKTTIKFKGEFVVIIPKNKNIELDNDGILVERIKEMVDSGSSIKDAIKSMDCPHPSQIYKLYVNKYKKT